MEVDMSKIDRIPGAGGWKHEEVRGVYYSTAHFLLNDCSGGLNESGAYDILQDLYDKAIENHTASRGGP